MADFKDLSKCTKSASTEIYSANILGVSVATTGYCGGDSGHGGRTYFSLEDLSSTDMSVRFTPDEMSNGKLEIMLGGDCELDSFIEALRWAADKLEELASTK